MVPRMQQSDSAKLRRIYRDTNLQILFGVTLVAVMGVSSIAPALPRMLHAMAIPPAESWWLISSFTVPGVLFAPVAGVLSDTYGRKAVLVPSLVIFGLFGGLCALTTNMWVLVGLRFLQGIGASSLWALCATIIGDMYAGRERMQAMGYSASVLSIGTTIFPLVGGGLAAVGWQWPFELPLLALPLAVVVALWLKVPQPQGKGEFMKQMRRAVVRASSPRALCLFATTGASFIILYGVIITYLPIYLSSTFAATPPVIGSIIAISSLTSAGVASQVGRLSGWVAPRTLLVAAFVLYALSAVLIPVMPGAWSVAVPVLLFGVAQAFNIPTVQALLAGMAPMEERGAFMALNGMVLRIGQTLGPLVMGTAYTLGGLRGVFWTGGVIGALMVAVLTGVFVFGRGLDGQEERTRAQ
ncbi:MFS transporter [Desulfobaculum senezii]